MISESGVELRTGANGNRDTQFQRLMKNYRAAQKLKAIGFIFYQAYDDDGFGIIHKDGNVSETYRKLEAQKRAHGASGASRSRSRRAR